jgi:heat-inducible transcriptional repressor
MDELSERNKQILWAIIQSYTTMNTPVGSIKVTQRFSFGLSPATVRSIMASLEEMGYVKQPHTSAGRIPTERGYRLYVNSLLKEKKLSASKALFEKLSKNLFIEQDDSGRLIKEAAKTLSSYSHYLSVAAQSSAGNLLIKDLKLIQYEDKKVLCILIADDESVKNSFITLNSSLPQSDLDALSGYLNNLVRGLSFSEATVRLTLRMQDEESRNEHIEEILAKCRDFISKESDNLIINELAGTPNLPDFANLNQVKDVLQAIEDRNFYLNILHEVTGSKGVRVFVGMEEIMPSMKGLSMVASTYKDKDQSLGTIGIIGPTNMNYRKLIPVVAHTAKTITEILSDA